MQIIKVLNVSFFLFFPGEFDQSLVSNENQILECDIFQNNLTTY